MDSRIRKGVDVVVAVAVNAPFRFRSSSALVSFCFFFIKFDHNNAFSNLLPLSCSRFVCVFLCLLACDSRFFLLFLPVVVCFSLSLSRVLFSVTIIIN